MVNKPECLQTLKDAGIKRVIDLVGFNNYDNQVKEAGLDYLHFNISYDSYGFGSSFWNSDAFLSKEEFTNKIKQKFYFLEKPVLADKFINDFDSQCRKSVETIVNYIRKMQEGYCYIGCEYGKTTTDDAMLLDNVLNPKKKGNLEFRELFQINCFRNLYDKLTDNDKIRMKWTKDFDANFLQRLKTAEEKLLAKLDLSHRGFLSGWRF
ncbi:unknown [Brachyspira sp. CAG:484]|nr:unknown [Brachyspira sp. CAG:484]